MTALFLEKAFWGFLGLVAALIVVIYRLFSSIVNKDIRFLQKEIDDLKFSMRDIDAVRNEISNIKEKIYQLQIKNRVDL